MLGKNELIDESRHFFLIEISRRVLIGSFKEDVNVCLSAQKVCQFFFRKDLIAVLVGTFEPLLRCLSGHIPSFYFS